MDFFARLTSAIVAGFLLENASEGILLEDYSIPPIQSHKGFRSSSSIAKCANALIKRDGMPQANFRLFHASRDARVAGQVGSRV